MWPAAGLMVRDAFRAPHHEPPAPKAVLHTDHEHGIVAVGFRREQYVRIILWCTGCPAMRLVPIACDCTFWRALRFPLERFAISKRSWALGGTSNQKRRKDIGARMSDLAMLDPRAAFVDVGSEKMHVSIAGGSPAVFGTVTSQLHALRDYLAEHQVRSVAMEATGVYWLPLYGVLEAAGMQVVMVDGRQTRNLPGRKTDMKDCQWGATLHAHGLLRAGFVPPANIRRLQDYLRLRGDHIAAAAGHVQHMQKALERMNIKLHEVISSLTGASGLAVIRAILAGERDPQVLLDLCDIRIRNVKAERVVESLRGDWAEEHLFALAQAVQSWDHYQGLIAACDRQIAVVLRQMPDAKAPPSAASRSIR